VSRTPYRILVCSPSLEDIGGVSTFTRLLLEYLSKDFRPEHFPIANRPENRNVLRQLGFFLRDYRTFKERISKNAYDIIHLNPSFRILALPRDTCYLFRASRTGTGKTLVMFHGWDEKLARKIRGSVLLGSLFKRIYGKAGIIVVLSRDFKDQMIGMGLDASRIIVMTTMFGGDAFAGIVPEKRKDGRIRLLFMARLSKGKGPYVVVGVVKKLVESGFREISCVLAGEGPEFLDLKKAIEAQGLEDYVTMPGNIRGEAKKKVLAQGDIFLLPSVSEGCPISLLEAMGAGQAVVATSVGAIPDIVKDGENGFLMTEPAIDAAFEAVVRLVRNRELLGKIQAVNRRKAQEKYAAAVVTVRMEELYRSLISGPALTEETR